MTLTRVERAAFLEMADAMRAVAGGSDVLTGDDALNYMIQAAGGA